MCDTHEFLASVTRWKFTPPSYPTAAKNVERGPFLTAYAASATMVAYPGWRVGRHLTKGTKMNGLIRYAEKLFKGTNVTIRNYDGNGFCLVKDGEDLLSIINSGYGSKYGLLEMWDYRNEEPRGWLKVDSVKGTLRAFRKRNKIRG